jgi:LacI family transcriptional regulator
MIPPPKYQRLVEEIALRIRRGEWMPGDRLPSEPDLAKEYGVAYMTVRSAVSALVETGQLRRIRGRGTFVVEPAEPITKPTLALLLPPHWPTLDPFYFPLVVSGFTHRAEELGFHVHLAGRTEPLLEFIELREHHSNAVACVMIDANDQREAELLLDHGVSIVAINRYRGTRRITWVQPDNFGGSYDAARHLIGLGHSRIVYLEGPRENLDAQERYRGARQAVLDAGLEPIKSLPGTFQEQSGYDRLRDLLAQGERPTAVMAASDLAAIGAMKALAEAGVRIPQDASMVGFGNFRPGAFLHPSLTTTFLPLEDVGAKAAEVLAQQLRGYRTESVSLPCPVILRESVAPPG